MENNTNTNNATYTYSFKNNQSAQSFQRIQQYQEQKYRYDPQTGQPINYNNLYCKDVASQRIKLFKKIGYNASIAFGVLLMLCAILSKVIPALGEYLNSSYRPACLDYVTDMGSYDEGQLIDMINKELKNNKSIYETADEFISVNLPGTINEFNYNTVFDDIDSYIGQKCYVTFVISEVGSGVVAGGLRYDETYTYGSFIIGTDCIQENIDYSNYTYSNSLPLTFYGEVIGISEYGYIVILAHNVTFNCS